MLKFFPFYHFAIKLEKKKRSKGTMDNFISKYFGCLLILPLFVELFQQNIEEMKKKMLSIQLL